MIFQVQDSTSVYCLSDECKVSRVSVNSAEADFHYFGCFLNNDWPGLSQETDSVEECFEFCLDNQTSVAVTYKNGTHIDCRLECEKYIHA